MLRTKNCYTKIKYLNGLCFVSLLRTDENTSEWENNRRVVAFALTKKRLRNKSKAKWWTTKRIGRTARMQRLVWTCAVTKNVFIQKKDSFVILSMFTIMALSSVTRWTTLLYSCKIRIFTELLDVRLDHLMAELELFLKTYDIFNKLVMTVQPLHN